MGKIYKKQVVDYFKEIVTENLLLSARNIKVNKTDFLLLNIFCLIHKINKEIILFSFTRCHNQDKQKLWKTKESLSIFSAGG